MVAFASNSNLKAPGTSTFSSSKSHGGNTLFHVYALTDETGAIAEAVQSYDGYGKVSALITGSGSDSTWFTSDDVLATNPNVSAIGNPWFYTGQRIDPETGLGYHKNRFFMYDLGRWATRDPIGYDSGVNLYEYVNSMPTYFFDGLGLMPLAGSDCKCWNLKWVPVYGKQGSKHWGLMRDLGDGASTARTSVDIPRYERYVWLKMYWYDQIVKLQFWACRDESCSNCAPGSTTAEIKIFQSTVPKTENPNEKGLHEGNVRGGTRGEQVSVRNHKDAEGAAVPGDGSSGLPPAPLGVPAGKCGRVVAMGVIPDRHSVYFARLWVNGFLCKEITINIKETSRDR